MYYFKHWTSRNEVLLPLTITERLHDFDVEIKVSGGGFSGKLVAILFFFLTHEPSLTILLSSLQGKREQFG